MAETIYLSGKMTGKPDFGRALFLAAENALKKEGYRVLNPARLPIGMPKEKYMPICTAMIEAADTICMLGDWEQSAGAVLEMQYAQYQNKRVVELWPSEK